MSRIIPLIVSLLLCYCFWGFALFGWGDDLPWILGACLGIISFPIFVIGSLLCCTIALRTDVDKDSQLYGFIGCMFILLLGYLFHLP